MSKKEFTIPVVLDPSYIAKLDEIEKAVAANYEAIEELKKIRFGTGLVTGVDLNEDID